MGGHKERNHYDDQSIVIFVVVTSVFRAQIPAEGMISQPSHRSYHNIALAFVHYVHREIEEKSTLV